MPCSHPSLGLLGPFLSFSDTLFHGTWLPFAFGCRCRCRDVRRLASRRGVARVAPPPLVCWRSLPYLTLLRSAARSAAALATPSRRHETRAPGCWPPAIRHVWASQQPRLPHLQLSPLVHPSAPLAPPLRPRAAASLSPPLPGLKIGRPPRAVSARLLGPDRTT